MQIEKFKSIGSRWIAWPTNSTELNSECVCPEGQIIELPASILYECKNYHFSCKTCCNSGIYGCLTCSQLLKQNISDGSCTICLNGYYYDGSYCQKCLDRINNY